jgi:hypothetical protein
MNLCVEYENKKVNNMEEKHKKQWYMPYELIENIEHF